MKFTVKALLFSVLAGWGIGIWRGWWAFGWLSVGITVFIVSFLLVGVVKTKSGAPPASPEAVHAYIRHFHENSQQRKLRLLRYEAAADWPNQRAEEGIWIGMKFFLDRLGLLVRVSVSPIIEEENLTSERIQAYAKNYFEQQIGCTLVRNEISTFSGHPCVISDAVHAQTGKVRRYSFSLQMSEYCIQFTSVSKEHFTASESFINEFIGRCRIELPDFQERVVLGGGIRIGVPDKWRQVRNLSNIYSWEASPGPLKVSLHFIGDEQGDTLLQSVFNKLPGFQSRNEIKYRFFQMPDNGIRVLRAVSRTKNFEGTDKWVMDAVKLPSGLVVVLETEHFGSESDKYEGLLLEPLRYALLASMKDAGIEII